MNRLFALLMLLLLAVCQPGLAQDGEVVRRTYSDLVEKGSVVDGVVLITLEDPYMTVDCAALLGKITVDEITQPLYSYLFNLFLGEDKGTWDDRWLGRELQFRASAAECEFAQGHLPDEPAAADTSEELRANSPVWDDPDGEEMLVALVTSDDAFCYSYINWGIDEDLFPSLAERMTYRQTFINDCIGE